MSLAPGHDELYEVLPEAALGTLEGGELERVMEHVRSCEACAERLREYREVVAELALLAPPAPPDATRGSKLRSRLLARIRSEPASPRPASRVSWLGWAVAAGLGGILLVHHSVHRPVAYGWLAAGILGLLLLLVGVYAGIQRGRVEGLRRQLGRAGLEDGPD